MLFATLKYHWSDFQLKLDEKFACAKFALKDLPPFCQPFSLQVHYH